MPAHIQTSHGEFCPYGGKFASLAWEWYCYPTSNMVFFVSRSWSIQYCLCQGPPISSLFAIAPPRHISPLLKGRWASFKRRPWLRYQRANYGHPLYAWSITGHQESLEWQEGGGRFYMRCTIAQGMSDCYRKPFDKPLWCPELVISILAVVVCLLCGWGWERVLFQFAKRRYWEFRQGMIFLAPAMDVSWHSWKSFKAFQTKS